MKKLLLFLSVLCIVSINILSTNASASEVSNAEAPPFDLSALTNKKEETMLCITYFGTLNKNNLVTVDVTNASSIHSINNKITTENTSTLIGPIKLGVTYKIAIKETPLRTEYTGTFSISKDPKENSNFIIDYNLNGKKFTIKTPQSTQQYYAYEKDGTQIGSHSSLYKAINSTYSYGAGSYVKNNDSEIVFTRGSSSTYFKYQFTNYCGSTTLISNADSWIDNYSYSHVIRGDGTFYKNSYVFQNGIPDKWSLEPQSGGYVYKFSKADNNYRKVSATILLKDARLKKPAEGDQQYNAYVYMSAQNERVTADAGIYCGHAAGGDWKICSNVDGKFKTYQKICGSKLVDGEYVPDADIQMTYSYSNGALMLIVKNLTTNVTATPVLVYNSKIGGNMALISGTSFVPDITPFQTPDYKVDAYFKNIVYQDWRIYDSYGNSYDFGPTSSTTNYSLQYNDDYCNYAGNSVSEKVDILYNDISKYN
jgi:hypothetical protein